MHKQFENVSLSTCIAESLSCQDPAVLTAQYPSTGPSSTNLSFDIPQCPDLSSDVRRSQQAVLMTLGVPR